MYAPSAPPPLELPMLRILRNLLECCLVFITGADPGFPVGEGANPPGGGGCQHMILPNFEKNCMKLRKFWAVGGGGGDRTLRASSLNPPLYYILAN